MWTLRVTSTIIKKREFFFACLRPWADRKSTQNQVSHIPCWPSSFLNAKITACASLPVHINIQHLDALSSSLFQQLLTLLQKDHRVLTCRWRLLCLSKMVTDTSMWNFRAIPSITKTPWSAYDVFVPKNFTNQLKRTHMECLVSSPCQYYISNMDLLCLCAYKYPPLSSSFSSLFQEVSFYLQKQIVFEVCRWRLLCSSKTDAEVRCERSYTHLVSTSKFQPFVICLCSRLNWSSHQSQTWSQCVDWVRCSKRRSGTSMFFACRHQSPSRSPNLIKTLLA